MRYMMIVKASPESETGVLPTAEQLAEMGKYNEELVKAGIMLAGEGLHDSSKGVRVRYQGKQRSIVDGPFTESKELVAGFWILQVRSKEEAIEWAKRVPFEDGEVELRQVFETEEFAASDPTGELRAAEHELRARVEAQNR